MKRHRALLVATAVLGFVAFVAGERHEPDTESSASSQEGAMAAARTNDRTAPETRAMTSARHASDTDVHRQIAEKYDALLARLDNQARKRLQALLAARESSKDPDTLEHERLISLLLPEHDYALYERLRESDHARTRLEMLTQGLSETASLSDQQRRDLLVAMLEHDSELQMLELQLDGSDANVPAMESAYRRDIAAQGLDHHHRAFLEAAKSILDANQWEALRERASRISGTGE